MTDLEVSEWLNSDKVVFENTTDFEYKILHKIHPFKQKEVGNLIVLCNQFSLIKKVIIFGSSITSGCTPWSDLDIAIDWECNAYNSDGSLNFSIHEAMMAIQRNSKYNIDIVQLQDWERMDLAFQRSIKKGIKVYEKYV